MFRRQPVTARDPEPPWRLWQALECPVCGTPPEPGTDRCPGCGRPDRTPSGALDYLRDESREEAARFAEEYIALRRREGWRDSDGREDPDRRFFGRLWRSRKRAAAAAAKLVKDHLFVREPPLIADVGAGGGWLARLLGFGVVAAVDWIEPPAGAGAHLRVVADMRRLPFRDGSLQAVVYCSSLQFEPVDEVVGEAARVLALGGVMVAVESAIFATPAAGAAAHERTSAYFERVGVPGLTRHHFSVVGPELRRALEAGRMVIERLDPAREDYGAIQMMHGANAFPTLVARRS